MSNNDQPLFLNVLKPSSCTSRCSQFASAHETCKYAKVGKSLPNARNGTISETADPPVPTICSDVLCCEL